MFGAQALHDKPENKEMMYNFVSRAYNQEQMLKLVTLSV